MLSRALQDATAHIFEPKRKESLWTDQKSLMHFEQHGEIIQLRRKVNDLEPRAHAYDTIAILARQSAPKEQSYGTIDPAWVIKALVEKIETERTNEKE